MQDFAKANMAIDEHNSQNEINVNTKEKDEIGVAAQSWL